MKKLLSLFLVAVLLLSLVAGCAKPGEPGKTEVPATKPTTDQKDPTKPAGSDYHIVYLLTGGKLGDQAANDAQYEGCKRFADRIGARFDAIELEELIDLDATVRQMAAEGVDIITLNSGDGSDMMDELCTEFPDIKFLMQNGTNYSGYDNLYNVTSDVAEAAFLCGIFATEMNVALGGEKKCGYVGGVRNPNLERARYSMQAAAELLGGQLTAVYVGNFTDAAAAKEITQQMHSDGIHIVQAWAGGCNKGVYEAAETAGEGYLSMGAATGQFHMSDTIVASLASLIDVAYEKFCEQIYEGTLEPGLHALNLKDGTIDCVFAPDERANQIPEAVAKKVEEYRQKLINGELFAPKTEEEYNDFVKKFIQG